jgi:hypothetical protein
MHERAIIALLPARRPSPFRLSCHDRVQSALHPGKPGGFGGEIIARRE